MKWSRTQVSSRLHYQCTPLILNIFLFAAKERSGEERIALLEFKKAHIKEQAAERDHMKMIKESCHHEVDAYDKPSRAFFFVGARYLFSMIDK